ncbi:MAG TPA: prepilin-type N-terminal cleavage/methylation domain-containing protein [Candidatus Saccharimonadales bacterium]
MGKVQKDESGFSVIEVILVLVIVALIAACGVVAYRHHHKTTAATTTKTSSSTKASTSKSSTSTSTSTTDAYAGWLTYASSDEGLSLKYPTTWTAQNDPCVNPDTQAAGQCYQFLTPPSPNSPYIYEVTYYWNQQKPGVPSGGETIKSVTPLSVPNSKTPLSVVSYSLNQQSSTNVFGLSLTDQKYTVGQTVSYIPNVTSQKQNGMTYTLDAIMKTPAQDDIPDYPLAQYQAQPDYANVIKMFESLSY